MAYSASRPASRGPSTAVLLTMAAFVAAGGAMLYVAKLQKLEGRAAPPTTTRAPGCGEEGAPAPDPAPPHQGGYYCPPHPGFRLRERAPEAAAEAKANALALLVCCEGDVQDPAKLDLVRLKLPDLVRAAGGMDDAFKARAKDVEWKLTVNRMKAAYDKAQEESAAAGIDLHAKLAAYDKAAVVFRDYFRRLNNIPKDDPVLVTYREMLKESDALLDRLLTPTVIAEVPSRDMLSQSEITAWGASEGIRHELLHRELVLEGVLGKEGKKVTGIMSIAGWKVPEWHDLYLEYEFEIVIGGFEMFLRYRPDGFKFWSSAFKTKEGYLPGRTYKISVLVKGSMVTITQDGEPLSAEQLDATVSRTGGIGFALTEGSKIILKNVKLKVLRPR